MFRLGRTLFFSITLLGLLSLSPLQAIASDPSSPDCFKDFFKTLLDHPEEYRFAHAAHRYNEVIEGSLSRLSRDEMDVAFETALSQLEPLNSSFPKKEFMEWFKENPFTNAEFRKIQAEGKTLGDALHAKALAFEATKGSGQFAKTARELEDKMAELRKICGEDPKCHEKGIRAFVEKNDKKLFSCLRGDADTRNAIINGFVVSNTGLVVSQIGKKDAKASDFPYEILLNNVFWTPILGEIACKNKARAAIDQVGKHVDETPQRKNKLAVMAKAWWTYMWPASPLNELSYMALHIGAEKMRGHEVNTDPSHLAKEFGMYIVWDAAIAVPRNVLVLDPLYTKLMPSRFKPMVQNLVKNGSISKVVYASVEGLSRVGVGAVNTRMFQWYEKSILAPVVNGSEEKPKEEQPQESSGSITPGSSHAAADPIEPSAPLVKKPSVPAVKVEKPIPHQSCDSLRAQYEKCANRCIDSNPDVDLTATSKKYKTPTCKECVDVLDAYEAQCGTYW